MALFNLTDIAYKRDVQRNFVPRGKLGNSSDGTVGNTFRYPIDLGNTDRGHYMMIHINVQEKTSYKYDYEEVLPTIQRNRIALKQETGATNIGGFGALSNDNLRRFGSVVGENTPDFVKQSFERAKTGFSDLISEKILSKGTTGAVRSDGDFAGQQFINDFIAAGKVGLDVFGGAVKGAEQALGNLNNQNFLRTIKRTTESIALYMPGTMAYNHTQSYNKLSMGGENAAFYGSGMSLITGAVNGEFNPEQLGKNLTPFIAEKLKNLSSSVLGTNSATGLFASAIGGVQNPQLELIYNSPDFRSFRFDFMFYPSSEAEASEVALIIDSLKFHQAPEIMEDTAGYFLVPPSEFDIEFYYNGVINPNIPKISTCVLTSIDMDFAPKGFVAYEVPGQPPEIGGTGMPFAIRLSLSFQETEIMTKYNFQNFENYGTPGTGPRVRIKR